jgi:hypothetical protein
LAMVVNPIVQVAMELIKKLDRWFYLSRNQLKLLKLFLLTNFNTQKSIKYMKNINFYYEKIH